LVELLVVIAIIGILVGMLLPAVQMVREAARRTQCSNNSRQLGLAIANYESTHQQFPSGWSTNNSKNALAEPGWGWSAQILPFVEANNLYNQIDFRVGIDDPSHRELINQVVPVFLCPTEIADDVVDLGDHVDHGGTHFVKFRKQHEHENLFVGRSNHSGVFGSSEIEDSPLKGNGVFFANSETTLSDIRDGSSNTLMIGERSHEFGAVSWVGMVPEVDEPFARIVAVADHAPNNIDGHFEDFRSYHPGGINVTLADGSSHFISDSISPELFQSLATKSGGETAAIPN
ncbi:MAG: type II secretory pathway pseudopilin PulG, partial [Mariniblastus sp.]